MTDRTTSDEPSSGGASAEQAAGGAPLGASGGDEAEGGAAPTGGALSSGGQVDDVQSGGAPASGGVSASGGAPPTLGPFFPRPGSENQCPDPSLRLRFEHPPLLGNQGEVRVYDVAEPEVVVARIDIAAPSYTEQMGGLAFNMPSVYVSGNEVIFLLPSSSLKYGHSYFVLIDEGVLGMVGEPGISDPQTWRFSVAKAAPADHSHLRVALDGAGQFCSLQGAIDAADNGTTITIEPGDYYGVTYATDLSGLRLVGAERDTTRVLGVNNNNLNPSTRTRALFGTEHLQQLTIENLTLENLTEQGGSQAEALTLLSCDECIVRNSTIISRQDTLLWSGRIYAEDSRIEGNVDYIWGTGAAYFNRVEVRTIGRSGYNVQARNTTGHGYVFVDSRLTADPGIEDDVLARIDVSAYPNSHVAYIDCEIGPHIADVGWSITGSGSRAGLRFWEYGSHTPDGEALDVSRRADGSRQLTAEQAAQMRDPAVVLGGWDPR